MGENLTLQERRDLAGLGVPADRVEISLLPGLRSDLTSVANVHVAQTRTSRNVIAFAVVGGLVLFVALCFFYRRRRRT
jgi:hypothetical protein